MATKYAAAAADLVTGRPRKRARLGWDVASAAEVNTPHRLLSSPICCNSGYCSPLHAAIPHRTIIYPVRYQYLVMVFVDTLIF
ncbi:Serine/threonine-protein kinase AFC2 [Zea mays]|uniref:Serine/threonine-protein kinase AFC2 n=1 Tax=Zea mays TaxID=4577 RepID=A0A1D6EM11_MAIZE|nr:Serine/threonine-protein kinase AFC2 [Zea mays]